MESNLPQYPTKLPLSHHFQLFIGHSVFHNECLFPSTYSNGAQRSAHKTFTTGFVLIFFSQTSRLFLSIFSFGKASVCLGASENTTINSTFQFVSGKHTFECTTRRLLDKLICMNFLFPSEAAPQYVESPSGLSDRLHAAKKAITFHPKASACAWRRYSLQILCALEQDVSSVLFSLRFKDVANMLSFSWEKKDKGYYAWKYTMLMLSAVYFYHAFDTGCHARG